MIIIITTIVTTSVVVAVDDDGGCCYGVKLVLLMVYGLFEDLIYGLF